MLVEKEISEQMAQHMENQLLPFWKKSMDFHYGGVLLAIQMTAKRISNDKYIWSAFLMDRIKDMQNDAKWYP